MVSEEPLCFGSLSHLNISPGPGLEEEHLGSIECSVFFSSSLSKCCQDSTLITDLKISFCIGTCMHHAIKFWTDPQPLRPYILHKSFGDLHLFSPHHYFNLRCTGVRHHCLPLALQLSPQTVCFNWNAPTWVRSDSCNRSRCWGVLKQVLCY